MPSTINVIPDIVKGQLRKKGAADANLAFQTNGTNAVTIDNNQNANFVSTGAIVLPKGTTAQRPASPVNGMWRYNTDYAYVEVYVNNAWGNLTPILTPISNTSPVVAGSTTVGGVANVTNGTWNNSPTSYTYQWYANSSAITSATANTFTITSTQIGVNLSCGVTAINTAGSTTANSNSVGPVTSTYSASYLVVGGGGGSPDTFAGGGGAGGLLANTATFTPGVVYTATVGGGGSGTDGTNSSLSGTGLTTITAYGGGKGGTGGGSYSDAGSGGSGGGAGGFTSSYNNPPGSGTTGQGYGGGNNSRSSPYGAGGGGGAGAAGGNGGSPYDAGVGGIGVQSSITGTPTYYAGGGGGACNSSLGYGAGGGSGGGGTGGGIQNGGDGTAGTANTGGGAGGHGYYGGSGVVILSVPTASYSGTTTGSPTVTTSGANTILKYTSSGTYTA